MFTWDTDPTFFKIGIRKPDPGPTKAPGFPESDQTFSLNPDLFSEDHFRKPDPGPTKAPGCVTRISGTGYGYFKNAEPGPLHCSLKRLLSHVTLKKLL